MDFVSAHRGAIPAEAMSAEGQFAHPLVVRAKLAIAAACHGLAKTPSHNVVTEFGDPAVVAQAARRAAREFGYTRMWSIHPKPDPADRRRLPAAEPAEVDEALAILDAAADAGWAPIQPRRSPARPRQLSLLLAACWCARRARADGLAGRCAAVAFSAAAAARP